MAAGALHLFTKTEALIYHKFN